jgi:hypothetical protein
MPAETRKSLNEMQYTHHEVCSHIEALKVHNISIGEGGKYRKELLSGRIPKQLQRPEIHKLILEKALHELKPMPLVRAMGEGELDGFKQELELEKRKPEQKRDKELVKRLEGNIGHWTELYGVGRKPTKKEVLGVIYETLFGAVATVGVLPLLQLGVRGFRITEKTGRAVIEWNKKPYKQLKKLELVPGNEEHNAQALGKIIKENEKEIASLHKVRTELEKAMQNR